MPWRKVDNSLSQELKKLDHAQKMAMRMHNNIQQRFRNKYIGSSRSIPTFSADSITSKETKDDNTQDIIDLLFINGELDTDRLLCLHLLTTHPCEALRPPPPGLYPLKLIKVVMITKYISLISIISLQYSFELFKSLVRKS